MAEEKQEKKQVKTEKKIEEKKKNPRQDLISKELMAGKIVRILQTDIPGSKNVYAGLTRIRGVSWAISNAVCKINNLDKNKKIESLTKEEVQKIETTLKEHKFPNFILNRRKDFTTGTDSHIIGSNLDLVEELDIKRLKKIRSYRGLRHATGQPTRGQRTKSHFRTNRKKGVGIKVKTTNVKGASTNK
jgi:small subunit ribosomal protein S13